MTSGLAIFATLILAVRAEDNQKASLPVSSNETVAHDLQTFLTMVSCHFINAPGVKHDNSQGHDVHSLIDSDVHPVDIPALYPARSVYFVEKIDNIMTRQQILAATQREPLVINVQPYEFTDPSKFIPGEFDLERLSKLELSDLKTRPECGGVYTHVEPGLFIGDYPFCTDDTDKIRGMYTFALTCHSFNFMTYQNLFPEDSNPEAYNLVTIERYPLLPYMMSRTEDVSNPCDD